jgi:putative membrane protein
MSGRIWWIVAFFALFVFALSFGGMAFMMGSSVGYGGWGMMGYRTGYETGYGWVLVPFFRLFLSFLVVAGLIFFVTGFSPGGKMRHDGSLAIAKERYARGEVTREEYEEIKKTILES